MGNSNSNSRADLHNPESRLAAAKCNKHKYIKF